MAIWISNPSPCPKRTTSKQCKDQTWTKTLPWPCYDIVIFKTLSLHVSFGGVWTQWPEHAIWSHPVIWDNIQHSVVFTGTYHGTALTNMDTSLPVQKMEGAELDQQCCVIHFGHTLWCQVVCKLTCTNDFFSLSVWLLSHLDPVLTLK